MASAREGLAEVLVFFRSSRRTLARKLEALEAGDPVKGSDALPAVSDLRRWAQALNEELGKLERSIGDAGGEPGAGELDLDRARHTIGGRLARLRASGGAGGVPG